MALVVFGMRLLELVFFLGIVGSAVVVVISSVEDVGEFLVKEQHAPAVDKTR